MLRLMLRLLQIIKKIRLLNNTGFNIMLFYANSLINPPPYTIPLPLTGERDVSFWRYGVRCFISRPFHLVHFNQSIAVLDVGKK